MNGKVENPAEVSKGLKVEDGNSENQIETPPKKILSATGTSRIFIQDIEELKEMWATIEVE